ncbi:glycosyltransferase [Paracoccus suum]|uniref:Glycosyltransferase n=1 Tax=Paracoccus suum TaxID=2259340 RepID=A0A344PGR4_9RHOB|nr:glycosyltransferase [Paracoccus suum]AXC48569.1 glycosyltransferase [Paracoccus suum]
MRILYVCHDLDYWRAHREGMARIMAGQGASVALLCGVAPDAPLPDSPASVARAAAGIPADPGQSGEAVAAGPSIYAELDLFPLARHRLEPWRDLLLGRRVLAAVRHFRPDVIHLITLKPALFGGGALRFAGPKGLRVIATFPGLGRVFATDPPDRRQRLVTSGLRHALGGGMTVATFENPADRARLVAAGVVSQERSVVISGAGFDPAEFPPAPMPAGPAEGAPLRCLFAGRLLQAKGVGGVLEAARLLKAAGAPVRIGLAGPAGGDPDAVPMDVISAMAGEGLIDHFGQVPMDGMAELLARQHVLLLPTRYPEGTPRIIAEAGAVGRPSIVSAHPGCTAFVRHGREGIVLDPADGRALAQAIQRLVDQPETLERMGAQAQRRALDGGFTLAAVTAQFQRLYSGSNSA